MPALESDPHSGRCDATKRRWTFFFPPQATALLELDFFFGGGIEVSHDS